MVVAMQKLTRGLERAAAERAIKNGRVPALALPTSEEPLNSTLLKKIAKPFLAAPKGTKHRKVIVCREKEYL
ncbi:MAG: hypothetical protein ACTSPI_17540 [Candidatus Heimdallarchaeaceae archaeon]